MTAIQWTNERPDDHYAHVENPCSRFVCNWINRMAGRFGGTVVERGTGKTWDWGQALCREQFGPNWVDELRRRHLEDADETSVEIARRWEGGEWPAWVAVDAVTRGEKR